MQVYPNLDSICSVYDAIFVDTNILLHSPLFFLKALRDKINSGNNFYTTDSLKLELRDQYHDGWSRYDYPGTAQSDAAFVLDSIAGLYFLKKRVKTVQFHGDESRAFLALRQKFEDIFESSGIVKADDYLVVAAMYFCSLEKKTAVLSSDKALIGAGNQAILEVARNEGSINPRIFPFFCYVSQNGAT